LPVPGTEFCFKNRPRGAKSHDFFFAVEQMVRYDHLMCFLCKISRKQLFHFWPKLAEIAENVINTIHPGASLTTLSYNASAVKIYNATSSLGYFENKNVFLYIL
jgi:hypothetical protein